MSELQISGIGFRGAESIYHLSKLTCQDPDCLDPMCNNGFYKAVNENDITH